MSCYSHQDAVCEHLFPDGLEVSVSHDVLSEVQSAQAGAVWVAEELKETVLRLKLAVCVDQLHVPVAGTELITLNPTEMSTAYRL